MVTALAADSSKCLRFLKNIKVVKDISLKSHLFLSLFLTMAQNQKKCIALSIWDIEWKFLQIKNRLLK